MILVETLKSTRLKDWKYGLEYLLYALAGGLMPVWIGALLIRLYGRWNGFQIFFQHGEFAIYSTTLLAPTLFILLRDFKSGLFFGRKLFLITSFSGLFISAILYSGVASKELLVTSNIPIDKVFLMNLTLFLFCVSILTSYFVNVFESVRLFPDFEGMNNQNLNMLNENFEKLGG